MNESSLMHWKKTVGLATACLSVVLLAACSGGGRDIKALAPVMKIAVDPEYRITTKLQYDAPLKDPGFGPDSPLAPAIAKGAAPKESLRLFLLDHKLTPGPLLVEAMRERLKGSRRFKFVDKPETADAVIKLEITEYGFEKEEKGTRLIAVIAVESTLLNHDGRKIYDDSGSNGSDENQHRMLSELLADPALIEAAFHSAASKLALDQVNTLSERAGL